MKDIELQAERKAFEAWWDKDEGIDNAGPWTPDSPIQFGWAAWRAAIEADRAQRVPDAAAAERERILGMLTRHDWSPSNIFRRYYPSATGDWVDLRELRTLLASTPAPAQQEPGTPMDAHRAAYFMRRFLHEEKMLGPNEQAALQFTIAALEALEVAQHQEQPQQERVPMTREQVRGLMETVGYEAATPQEKADFINGIRHAERHHGIRKD